MLFSLGCRNLANHDSTGWQPMGRHFLLLNLKRNCSKNRCKIFCIVGLKKVQKFISFKNNLLTNKREIKLDWNKPLSTRCFLCYIAYGVRWELWIGYLWKYDITFWYLWPDFHFYQKYNWLIILCLANFLFYQTIIVKLKIIENIFKGVHMLTPIFTQWLVNFLNIVHFNFRSHWSVRAVVLIQRAEAQYSNQVHSKCAANCQKRSYCNFFQHLTHIIASKYTTNFTVILIVLIKTFNFWGFTCTEKLC